MILSEESKRKIKEASERGRTTYKNKCIDKYYEKPVLCHNCGKTIPYMARMDKRRLFCGHSCSAVFNNPKRAESHYCIKCGNKLNYRQKKFCSRVCDSLYKKESHLASVVKQLELGEANDHNSRQYYRKISEKKCVICGLDSWLDKEIPLVVDHIDGDHTNNFITNLRMICCNCDAQLPTYKGANKGHGRQNRK